MHPDATPPWDQRLPGEQWITLDSPAMAEQYLALLGQTPGVSIQRPDYPNAEGLYAIIRHADRIPENKVFVPMEDSPHD
jgi:hypothetical protein